jgi:hypothetical protein
MRDIDERKRIYTSRLQKGGALLDDMRVLIRSWDNTEDRIPHGIRVVGDNVLGKATRARAKDVYRRTFVHRFVSGNPAKAWKLVRPLEDREVEFEVIRPIYYWVTARSDALLYDFVTERLFPMSLVVRPDVGVNDTRTWIEHRLEERGQRWSETVGLRVARGLLAALRDFGILEGKIRKKVAPVYMPIAAFSYLAFILFSLGNSGATLVAHQDWRLFLLSPDAVERLFMEADQNHFLRFEAAGKIYRVEFPADTIEDMADVITRKRA